MKNVLVMIALATGLLVTAPARAEVASLDAAGVTIEVPDGWTTQTTAKVVALTAGDQTLGIILAVSSDADVEAAWSHLVKAATKQVPDLALGDRGDGRIGGMPAVLASGPGTAQGTDVSMVLGVITAPSGAYVALMVTAEKPAAKAHEAEMQQALDSIRPSDGAADPFADLSPDAAAFARKLVAAIEASAVKKFVALLAPTVEIDGAKTKVAKVKKALKKWPAKKGGIAAYLGLAEGGWHAQQVSDAMLLLIRGDDAGQVVTIVAQKGRGKWRVTGTMGAESLAP